MRCRGLHRVADPPYLGHFPFSALPCVAPYCVPGGIRVVSGEVGRQWITRRRFLCNPEVADARASDRSTRRSPDERLQPPSTLPVPFNRADIHPRLTHMVLTIMLGT